MQQQQQQQKKNSSRFGGSLDGSQFLNLITRALGVMGDCCDGTRKQEERQQQQQQ
jgi:hypothetical protein